MSCRPGEPVGAVGGVPPPEPLTTELLEIRGHLCNIQKDYPSTADAIRNCVKRIEHALAAAPRGAPAEPEGYQQKKIAILLNRLVLASIAKGAQSQLDLAAEDRITDADLEAIEQKILAAAAPRCAPQEGSVDCDNDVGWRKCFDIWPQDPASWCEGCLAAKWHDPSAPGRLRVHERQSDE